MTELIRTACGQETPAPGRWTFASGQPVVALAGPWWRQSRGLGRTTGGAFLITTAGSMSIQLRWDGLRWDRPLPGQFSKGFGTPGELSTSLTYQSFSIRPGTCGSWLIDGELIVEGRIFAARSTVTYHGVYRSGAGAIAWLGWRLPIPRSLVTDFPVFGQGRILLTADLNADAPSHLTDRSGRRIG